MKKIILLLGLFVGFAVCQAETGKAPPGDQLTYFMDGPGGGSNPFVVAAPEADVTLYVVANVSGSEWESLADQEMFVMTEATSVKTNQIVCVKPLNDNARDWIRSYVATMPGFELSWASCINETSTDLWLTELDIRLI